MREQAPRTVVAKLAPLLTLVLGCTGAIGSNDGSPAAEGPEDRPSDPDPTPLGGASPLSCDPAKATVGDARIWRLTRTQYDRTVADLLGDQSAPAMASLTPEVGQNGFANSASGLRVRETDAVQLQKIAKQLAQTTVSTRLSKIFSCDATKVADATCKRSFVEGFGKRAFRRPLEAAEIDRYLALYDAVLAKEPTGTKPIQAVVEAVLQSPKFLYRSELGVGPVEGGRIRLSPWETASALSYFFLDTMPDDALAKAADEGKLATAAEVEAQARRLLADPRAKPAIVGFWSQLFELEELEHATKDEGVLPNFDQIKGELAAETTKFVEHLLFTKGASFEELFTADWTFLSAGIAPIYGTSTAGLFQTDPKARAGFLTHPSLMSRFAVSSRTSPVQRGKFVRDKLLCHFIPDPPDGIDLNLPETLTPGMTRRQQLEEKTKGPACAGCHSLMNPIGFGFESLDAVGRYRTEEAGQPIDDQGTLTGTRDVDGPFKGAAELSRKLGKSAQVKECMAIQTFRWALGRSENQGDACAVRAIYDRFAAAGFRLDELPIAVATSDAFLYRRAP
jgi:hypothetical protein